MQASDDYNLLGQKLGPKGRQARDRLREAARLLMARDPMAPPTLTAIAVAADVKLTGVYRYYPDVGALYLDAMAPLRHEMAPLVAQLEQPWAAGAEHDAALAFARAHFAYWRDRRGALFLRNSLAEGGDARFIAMRTEWAQPLFHALADKLAAAHGRAAGEADLAVAGVILSGMERTTTLALQHISEDAPLPAGRQPMAVADIIATMLRHDYLTP